MAQEKKKVDVPAAAKTAFTAKFPQAQKVEWGIEKAGEYEAEFVLNGIESSAVYDAKGSLIEIETELKEAQLPQAIKTALTKDFAGYMIGEIAKNTDAKGIVVYEIEASKDKKSYELVFDNTGKLTKKEESKEGKEEEKK
jgi:hypothetical protein